MNTDYRQTKATHILAGLWATCLVASVAVAQGETPAESPLRFDLNSVISNSVVQDEVAAKKPRVPFGQAGAERITITAGIARDGGTGSDYQPLALSYSSFIDDDVEMLAEIGTWYFDQEGNNAGGASFSVGSRWHMVNRSRWSLFLDIGIGVLFSTDTVPAGGTGVNFLPRLGAGGTFEIGETGSRIVIGVRGHHISNARIFGDVSNPSRDAPMVYAGISIPF